MTETPEELRFMPAIAAADAFEPVPASSWGLLAFLTALNILNFVDRMLIASLAPLLIKDLGLTRAQIGLLAGFGFVFFYTFVGLFLGVAADRFKRFPLIGIGLALWSAMTVLSGFARSFLQLALPRIFVGVGEATLTPAALSMLGDAFPRRRLGLAIGVYYSGIPLGLAVALISSSFIAPRFGWRVSFFALGIIGLLATVLLFVLREPARRKAAVVRGAPEARPSVRELLRDLGRALVDRPALVFALAGGSLLCYGSGAALHGVTWLVEERGFRYADAAFRSGVVAVFAGFLGNLAGGAFSDFCAKRFAAGRLWSLAIMTAFFTIPAWLFYSVVPGGPVFYICWFFTSAGTTAWFGPLFSTFQERSPVRARSTMVAFALLVLNLLGVGPGPLITGMIGDRRGLSYGLLVSLVVTAMAMIPFVFAARSERARAT
ncbi:MAG TPA: MFS transporter [Thermoanaerobaculia bacterium]|jgi:predicted MFS family arabinose efflux permease|nr:MFS transporter [Thermoanaerobaculia bacterium]